MNFIKTPRSARRMTQIDNPLSLNYRLTEIADTKLALKAKTAEAWLASTDITVDFDLNTIGNLLDETDKLAAYEDLLLGA